MSNIKECEGILDFIVSELNSNTQIIQDINNSTSSKDGRHKGITGEDIIQNYLKKIDFLKYPYVIPGLSPFLKNEKLRGLSDYGNYRCLINIKVTTKNGADNSCGKNALIHSLTPYDGNCLQNNKYSTYMSALKFGIDNALQNSSHNGLDKDYYFLVCDINNKQFFWNSIRSLTHIVPNGSNIPFQIDWSKNKIRINRNIIQAIEFIMPVFKESILLSANKVNEYFNYFDE